MRTKLIESWITSLADSLGPMRAPIDDKRLTELYHAKDYNGMVARIRALLGLNMRIMLALVNKGGTNAPAWITLPATMPLLGTYEFQNLRVTMYLRKSFLCESTYESTVMAVAHELCHVVLNGMRHPLQSQEEVVDLTAMMLGFRDFYMTGCTYVLPGNDPQRINIMRQGYLTTEEVGYAAHHMTFR